MAKQDNVAIIRAIYSAFAAGDVKAILDSVNDQAEWTNHGPSTIPYAGSRAGRAQVLEFFEAIGASTTGGKVTPETFITQGDTVVVIGRYTATVRGSGAQIDTPIAHVFTLQNGKITKWVGFSDTASVAEAHLRASSAAGR
jgi:ketosteroid isomerase-like protein